jgi:hypothetical protein
MWILYCGEKVVYNLYVEVFQESEPLFLQVIGEYVQYILTVELKRES